MSCWLQLRPRATSTDRRSDTLAPLAEATTRMRDGCQPGFTTGYSPDNFLSDIVKRLAETIQLFFYSPDIFSSAMAPPGD